MLKNLLLLVVSLLLFGNLFAYGALYIYTGENPYGEGYRTYKKALHKENQERCQIPHPYFGQLHCQDVPLGGEISKNEPVLRMVSPAIGKKPVRVLVLGGSVASHLSRNISSNQEMPTPVEYAGMTLTHEHILQQVLSHHFKTNRIEVHNAAMPGGKQPQQLFKLQYLLLLGERYDVVLNVDGFNEIALPLIENQPLGNHVAYPRSYSRLVESVSTAYDTGCLDHANRYATENSRHPLTEVWRFFYIKTCHRRIELEALDATNPIARISRFTPAAEAAVIGESVAIWRNATQAIAKLADAYGFAYIHVLQPNQYVGGSKPLSEEEKRKYTTYAHYGDPIRKHYARLDFSFWLEPGHVRLLDLREVFQDHSETLYRDACCHLNNYGMALFAEEIAEQAKPVFRGALERE